MGETDAIVGEGVGAPLIYYIRYTPVRENRARADRKRKLRQEGVYEVITREPHSRSRIKNYPQSTGSSFTDRLEGLPSLEFVSIISNYASYECFIANNITSKKSVLNDALG